MIEKHLSDQEIKNYVGGLLSYRLRAQMALHMYDCLPCRHRFNIIAPYYHVHEINSFLSPENTATPVSLDATNSRSFILSNIFQMGCKRPLPVVLSALILIIGALFARFEVLKSQLDSPVNMVVNNQPMDERSVGIIRGSSVPSIVCSDCNRSVSNSQIPKTNHLRNLKKSGFAKRIEIDRAKTTLRFGERLSPATEIISKKEFEVSHPKVPPQSSSSLALITSRKYTERQAISISATRGTNLKPRCTDKIVETELEIASPEQVKFRWNKFPNAAKYHLYVSDDSQILLEEFESKTETSYVLKKRLEMGKIYKYKVVIALSDERTVFSNTTTFVFGEKIKKDFSFRKQKEALQCSQ